MTSEYTIAVHALVYLYHKQAVVSSSDLAENICTNPARIRKIMAKLKKAGLVLAKQGQSSGYYVHEAIGSLTLDNILKALEEDAISLNWKSGNIDSKCLVSSGMADVMETIYTKLNISCLETLKKISIEDINTMIFKEGEKNMKYDTIILGFGKAGKTLAATLAKKGEKVALVEKSPQMYGGTCINVGCIPSKSLVHSSSEAALHKEDSFKLKAKRYQEAIEEKRRITEFLRKKNYEKLASFEQITIYDGIGRFTGEKEVEVLLNEGGKVSLKADKIFINTGGTPIIPPIEGIKDNSYIYTSETLMDEEKLPKNLLLIGAGYIGMEFASMYANFGSKVTILQDGNTFLPKEDRDVAEEILKLQQENGIDIVLGAKVLRIEKNTVFFELDGEEKALSSDAILLATGRKANTESLQVEKAGIKLTSRGAVEVDDLLRTNIPGIWALGDVNGGPQFTFISLDDYRIILSQLQGGTYTREKRSEFAYSVFMDTPLGRVGMTEEQAKAQNLPIRTLKLPTAAIPKAQVLRKTGGFLKAIINTETNKILGVALLCAESYEMVNIIKLAMDLDLDYEYLRDSIYTHPTMTEAFNDLFSL